MLSARDLLARSDGQAAALGAKHSHLGFEFETFVAELFDRAGYAATRLPFEDYGVDVAVSSPKVRQDLGGPILVQVKSRFTPRASAETGGQLSRLIRSGRGSAGLLLTLGEDQIQEVVSEKPIILSMTAARFITLIEGDRLLESMVAARDQIVSPAL